MSRVLLFTSLILAAATLASQSAYCLAQQAVQDSVETSTQHVDETEDFDDIPHVQNQFSFGMAYQIAPDAFPELSRILHLLEPPKPDLVQAEAVCREALAKHQSEECELMLSAILSDREKNAEALRLLTGIIDRDGSNWQALVARSQVRSKLQDFEGASADSEAAAGIMQTVMFHESDDENFEIGLFDIFEVDFFDFEIQIPREPEMLAGMVAFIAVGCFGLCLRWGLRQKNEANGTWWQLVGVSAFVTAIWTIPLAVAATMTGLDIGQPPGLVWSIFIGLFAFFFIRGTMKPPNLTYVGKEALPECDSQEMLARIAQLSKRIGVATPTVRTQRAMHHAGDSAAAFVGGLAPHSVVLYDTILSQLRDDEQDAIIGHELGHVANRSIWVYTAVFPLTTTAMVILSYLGGGFFGVMAGSALRAGAFRLMSRRFEYDCDRRAALATSPDAVARGLRRIYARHVLGKSGLLSDIVHSTATHPSLNERIHAMVVLAASGQTDDVQSVTVAYDNERVAFCRKLVVVFSTLWLCLTAYGIAATLVNGDSLRPMLALFLAVFGPMFFIVLASRRALRIQAIRHKGRFRWANLELRKRIGILSCAGVFVVVSFFAVFPDLFAPNSPEPAILSAIVTLVILLVLLGGIAYGFSGKSRNAHPSRKSQRLAQSITAAIQRNDFDEVIEICKENYDVVKHDKQLKYSGAAALLATRQLEKFVPYCEHIRQEFPHFPPPAIALATTWLDQDEPAKALEAIRGIQMDLHKLDPLPAVMASRCLLAIGQLDEAKIECDRAVAMSPDEVSVTAQAACIALATGDIDEADRLIEQGNALLPAEPLLIVARAERAILSNDLTSLQTERDALAAALAGDKLLSLYSYLAKYDELLGIESSDDVWI